MSVIELTERDAAWARDLSAADETFRALTAPWTWPGASLWVRRDPDEVGYVRTSGQLSVPTVHVPEGPMPTRNYNDLDQLVEAGWRIDE